MYKTSTNMRRRFMMVKNNKTRLENDRLTNQGSKFSSHPDSLVSNGDWETKTEQQNDEEQM